MLSFVRIRINGVYCGKKLCWVSFPRGEWLTNLRINIRDYDFKFVFDCRPLALMLRNSDISSRLFFNKGLIL